jgi:hypothetical protein
MPDLSQRTLGKVIAALTAMLPADADTFPLMRDFWRTKLFEWGFPDWLVHVVLKRSMNWSVIIPDLFFARATTADNIRIEGAMSSQMLRDLTVMAYTETQSRLDRDALRLALQLDGFDVSNKKLTPIDGPVSVEHEKTRLFKYLRVSKLGRQNLITKHIEDAEDHFSNAKHHSAIGEARSALQAVIEEIVVLVEAKTQKRSGSGTKNMIDFLEREKFFSSDEQLAFVAAWAFLSSGNHPGMPSEEEGRIGTILCLELIQILLIKCKNLL